MKNKFLKCLSPLFLILPLITITSCNKETEKEKDQNTKVENLDLNGYISNITAANGVGLQYHYYEEEKGKRLANEVNEYDKNMALLQKYGSNEQIELNFTKLISKEDGENINNVQEMVALSSNDENNASITFKMFEGFNYSLYSSENDSDVLYNEIIDNSSLDKNDKDSYVTIDGLEDKKVYYLHCDGKGEKIELDQEDLDYQVECLYSIDNFTFINFGKIIKVIGMSNYKNGLYYDYDYNQFVSHRSNGTFYSDSKHKSYVIDNKTGLLYKIENYRLFFEYPHLVTASPYVEIDESKDTSNLPKEEYKSGIFDFKINDNDEFELIQLCDSTNLGVSNAFEDKYGNRFIFNKYLDKYVENTKTTFVKTKTYGLETDVSYVLNSNQEAIKIEKNTETNLYDFKLLNKDGDYVDLPDHGKFTFYPDDYLFYNRRRIEFVSYENGILTYTENLGYSNGTNFGYGKYNLKTKENKSINISLPALKSEVITTEELGMANCCYVEVGIIYFYNFKDVYYIDNIDELFDGENHYYSQKDLKNIKYLVKDCKYDDLVYKYKKPTSKGDLYYDIVLEKDENGKYVLNAIESGTLKELNKMVLQPING